VLFPSLQRLPEAARRWEMLHTLPQFTKRLLLARLRHLLAFPSKNATQDIRHHG
jgi:hypothetical protein